MTNAQLYLAIGLPVLANAALIGLLLGYINAKFEAMNERFNGLNNSVYERFNSTNEQLVAINQRFDDMRDLWRAELRRVEEVLDARLKHLEER